jgi:hypothetical protein
MSKMPTSQRWPKPAGSREISNATGVAAGFGVLEGRLKAVAVAVAVIIGGWKVAVGGRDVEGGGLVGDGVLSGSTEASTVSSAEPLAEVPSEGGAGEGVTVAIFVAAVVLVGELISAVASVLGGRSVGV